MAVVGARAADLLLLYSKDSGRAEGDASARYPLAAWAGGSWTLTRVRGLFAPVPRLTQ